MTFSNELSANEIQRQEKRDHEDFLLVHWKNKTIKLQGLLANHDFRPVKNIPITESLDYQQSNCFGLFVFSFLFLRSEAHAHSAFMMFCSRF